MLKLVVQRTFIDVVEVAEEDAEETRRVRSAPAVPHASEGGSTEDDDEASDGSRGLLAPLAPLAPLGAGPRTTAIVRNLPRNYGRDKFIAVLDACGYHGMYDLVYVPMEFGSGCAFGYAFVNFIGPDEAERFLRHFHGFSSWGVPCTSEADVSWSWSQGLEEHVERYRSSPVMHPQVPDECRPVLFRAGARVEFPPPTQRLPALRRLRSRARARNREASGSACQPSLFCGDSSSSARHGRGLPPAVPEDHQTTTPLLPGLETVDFCCVGPSAEETSDPVIVSPLLAGLEGVAQKGVAMSSRLPRKSHRCGPELKACSELSECSTEAPSARSLVSSSCSDAAARSCSGFAAHGDSILAQGLTLAPPRAYLPHTVQMEGSWPAPQMKGSWPAPGALVEIVGTYPSGEQATILAVDAKAGTYKIQMMRKGHVNGRVRTIKAKYARVLD